MPSGELIALSNRLRAPTAADDTIVVCRLFEREHHPKAVNEQQADHPRIAQVDSSSSISNTTSGSWSNRVGILDPESIDVKLRMISTNESSRRIRTQLVKSSNVNQ
eukprot:scaffold19705_cov58-Attheya_sp.AAC.4